MKDQQIHPEFENYINIMQRELDQERMKRMQYENELGNISAFVPAKDQNIAESQIDLKEELDRIHHLLSAHIIVSREDGTEEWQEPSDDRLKIFSDYGVKQIMNIISFYVNKNTLLSFYDLDTIKWKIRDFAIELSDLIYNRYEVFFYYPTPEDLFEKYYPLVKQKGINISEEDLYRKCNQWSKEELQSKLRHYPSIVLAIVDVVHSTYLRAFGGKERTSLRERLHISQNANQNDSNQFINQQKKMNIFKPQTW